MHNRKFVLFLLAFYFCALTLLPALSRPANASQCWNLGHCSATGRWHWGANIYDETGIYCYLILGSNCSGPSVDYCQGSGYNCDSIAYLYYCNDYSVWCNEDIYNAGWYYLGP